MTIRTPAEILVDLERECLAVDKALAERRWADCDPSWRAQRKLTHELDLAVRSLTPGTPESIAVAKRIARLTAYREGQLRKLRAFSSNISKKLSTIQRYRSYAKTVTRANRASIFEGTY